MIQIVLGIIVLCMHLLPLNKCVDLAHDLIIISFDVPLLLRADFVINLF